MIYGGRLLATAVAMALAGTGTIGSLKAESFDRHIEGFVEGVMNRDFGKAFDHLGQGVMRIGEIYERVDGGLDTASKFSEPIEFASAILAGEPLIIDEIVEMVEKDTENLRSIEIEAAEFGDPLQAVSGEALQSYDPAERASAMDKALKRGKALRKRYEDKLSELKRKEEGIQEVAIEARVTLDRGLDMQRVLEEINDSVAGGILNVAGYQLTYTLLDVVVYLNPTLTERWEAARVLAEDYEAEVKHMESTLRFYDTFRSWVAYYRWEEWVVEKAPPAKEEDGASPFQLGEQFRKGAAALEEAEDLVDEAEGVGEGLSSPEAVRIQALLDVTVSETGIAKEKARSLVEEARRKTSEAARQARFQRILGLATAVAGFGSAISRSASGSPNRAVGPSSPGGDLPDAPEGPPPNLHQQAPGPPSLDIEEQPPVLIHPEFHEQIETDAIDLPPLPTGGPACAPGIPCVEP